MIGVLHHQRSSITATSAPRGSIVPAVAMALLAVLAAIALALDRAWIDSAQVELATAADAAALAAARELASDDLLRFDARGDRHAAARGAALRVAAQNPVVGRPATLVPPDVRLGRLVLNQRAQKAVFLETENQPETAVVTARLNRDRGNPIALVIQGLARQSTADLARRAEATIDNRVLGVRAAPGFAVPALPLAILSDDPSGARTDSWQHQIVKRAGPDNWNYDPATGQVTNKPDGIPEITLSCALPLGTIGSAPSSNVRLIDLGGRTGRQSLADQIAHGWKLDDLADYGFELRLPQRPITPLATAQFCGREWEALRTQIGQCRICLLYSDLPSAPERTPQVNSAGAIRIRCTGLVAGRILRLVREPGRPPQIVFQPGILVSRAALTTSETTPVSGESPTEPFANPYIYKLTLTQ